MINFRLIRPEHKQRGWWLVNIVQGINKLSKRLKTREKYSHKWYMDQYKREIQHLKKHIVFLENLISMHSRDKDRTK